MTRNLLAISFLLPLAFVVGCGDPNNNCQSGEDCNTGTDDTGDGTGEFSAILRNVAPYSWAGDHFAWPYDENFVEEPKCAGTNSCDVSIDEASTFDVWVFGWNFLCVPQIAIVHRDGETVEVSEPWTGEGICGLAPDGEDGGWNIRTDIGSLNGHEQVWIHIASDMAVVTGDTFFYDDGEVLLEGWISEDLTQVYFHRVGPTGESERTLNLE